MSADLHEFDFQRRVWGYVILGDVLERDARIAEVRPGEPSLPSADVWDHMAADLAHSFIDRGDGAGWRRVPDWFALRWLPWSLREVAVRGEIVWAR